MDTVQYSTMLADAWGICAGAVCPPASGHSYLSDSVNGADNLQYGAANDDCKAGYNRPGEVDGGRWKVKGGREVGDAKKVILHVVMLSALLFICIPLSLHC